MFWIYILILLLIPIFQLFYKVKDIKIIRVFGFELRMLLLLLLALPLIIVKIFLPIPQYYINIS